MTSTIINDGTTFQKFTKQMAWWLCLALQKDLYKDPSVNRDDGVPT